MESTHFYGTFDGGGHKINNLNITSTEQYQGLFGYNKGTIKNIGIESGILNVGALSGGIVGYNIGNIDKCYNKASITCTVGGEQNKAIGGITGISDGR